MIYAGFWVRFAAVLIDGLILCIPSYAFGKIIPYAGGYVFGLFYYPVFYCSPLMGSPGKALMGLAVVHEQTGERITVKKAFLRYFASLLSAVILCIGYLMNLFTVKRQTLHDIISETVVIVKQPPIGLNYFKVWTDQLTLIINLISGDAPAAASAPQPQVSVAPAPPTMSQQSSEISKAIEDLHKLLQSGAISQEEYDQKKQELLGKL